MVFCRLDYWLISNSLYDSVTGTDIIPAIKTDHSAILLEFCNNVNDIKGPGYWKMNCSLLEDDDYINDITAKIPVWLAEGYKELSDNRNIWDWIKYNIRINVIQHSKRKANERNDKEKTLQNVYAKAKQNVDLDPNNASVKALNSAKENLELFYEEKVHGIVIRARARWHEHGERSSKYFLNLEKRNHVKKHIRRLKISGSTKTDPFNILSEQKRF